MLAHHFAGKFFIYCSLISYCILNCVKLKKQRNSFIARWLWLDSFLSASWENEEKLINQRGNESTEEMWFSSSDPAA